jgi:hypothetical protein
MENNEIKFYWQCTSQLAQGDIFGLDLVAPYADREIRIFRTKEGFHGSLVFASSFEARIWDYKELTDTLEGIEPHQRLWPFETNPQGLREMVIVYADLLKFFILASQTCDVSGPKSKNFAIILPIVTIASFITNEKLPIGLKGGEFSDPPKWATIIDVLCSKLGKIPDSLMRDPLSLPGEIHTLLEGWNPTIKKDREIKSQIRNSLNAARDNKKSYIYYLPPRGEFKMPEGFVDFCRPYILPIQTIQKLQDYRIVSLHSPYREEFGQKLGLFLSRVATPAPIKAPEI